MNTSIMMGREGERTLDHDAPALPRPRNSHRDAASLKGEILGKSADSWSLCKMYFSSWFQMQSSESGINGEDQLDSVDGKSQVFGSWAVDD